MTEPPRPTDAVVSELESTISRLGESLTAGTRILWPYTHMKLASPRRTRAQLLDEWTSNPATTGEMAEERLNQNLNLVDTLLGRGNRKEREVRQRLLGRDDFAALKREVSDNSAAVQYLDEFAAWASDDGPAIRPGEVGGAKVKDLVRLLARRKNIVLEGVPGTGKTHVVQQIAELWQGVTGRPLLADGSSAFRTMVMHPSTSYEDFLEGLRPGGSEPVHGGRFDQVELETASSPSREFGVGSAFFKDVCRKAAGHKDQDVLVLLDELNRCNVSSVLGDLMLALEPSKRARWHDSCIDCEGNCNREEDWIATYQLELPYSKQTFFVPDNVYVIATTNTTDRSVAPLDAAIRRRFAFVRLEPDFTGCGSKLAENSPAAQAVADTVNELRCLNEDILRPCLGPDALLGHSYAYSLDDGLGDDTQTERAALAARDIWQYDILPQLVDNVRSLGAEDLLDPSRANAWLAERPEIDVRARENATQALASLHESLRKRGLALLVAGTGLSRSVRIAQHFAAEAEQTDAPEPEPALAVSA